MRFRSFVLVVAVCVLSSLVTWQLASAQVEPQATPRGLITGSDLGFVPDRQQGRGIAGERYVRGNLYVKVGVQWIPVQFTGGYLVPADR